uniref:hypothetical protein n=1 Tax=uncultured Microbacterium sp. TaxID=191216 RepID=UPI0025E5B02B
RHHDVMRFEGNATGGVGGVIDISSITPPTFESPAPRDSSNLIGMLSKYTTRTDLSRSFAELRRKPGAA